MYRLKLIFLSLGLSVLVRGQQIGNYVNNGSFEIVDSIHPNGNVNCAKFWQPTDTNKYCYHLWTTSTSFSLPLAPYLPTGFQYPRTGHNLILTQFWCDISSCTYTWSRGYPRNRLKTHLKPNTPYCVKYFVVNTNNSTIGTDSYGAYFGDQMLDTIKICTQPLVYLAPQIQWTGSVITDTLNWIAISGTFVATGTEKYMMIGNFRSNLTTNTLVINPTYLPALGHDLYVDDVSVIELNLPAYAGPDKSCIPGDSVFIGREPDFAIDPGCIWYKLPFMLQPIDTISGLWVKPTSTSTYVVRQELDCSPLKWDTVVVFMDAVGLKDLQWYSDNIKLFPNPTETDLTMTFGNQADINKIILVNSIGQTIREEDLQIKNTQFTIWTSDLDKGIYLILFKTSSGTVTKTFVKN